MNSYGEDILPPHQNRLIEQGNFSYFPLEKALESLTIEVLQSLDFKNKINELKQVEDIIPQKQVNNLIRDILKKKIELQNSIKLNDINYSKKL